MYVENYLYNPLSSSLEPYDLMTFNGINVLAPRNNLLNGVIKLAGNLSQLIYNTHILFAISDYLIEHRTEISKAYDEKKNTKQNQYDFNPSILISFTVGESNPNSVDLTKEISRFPLSIEEQTSKILHNLESIQTGFSLNISDPSRYRNIFYCEDNSQPYLILKTLVANGYLKSIDESYKEYVITPEGKAISKNAKKSRHSKAAFIAMSFSDKPHDGLPDDDLEQIRNAFKVGIRNAGYQPIVIDEVKHNEYIPIKIDEQIGKSSFLVIDLTYRNDGAIFESGIAEGKGIPVIRCMRKSEFDNSQTAPHFDYKQKYIILWTTYEELAQMLEEHIRMSIGAT